MTTPDLKLVPDISRVEVSFSVTILGETPDIVGGSADNVVTWEAAAATGELQEYPLNRISVGEISA
ncbi:hypothetical protein DLD82_00305 [Methanospirillum stamsii]|uniref:Uncharacterized protein n=1 Tax=Methanospirillum stamsii TaxID=1277351 RepID=A0A2V2NFF2_9EURY|nr:hypothetical protein DLD82_00305 [Methanospirillum stamsii]